MRIYRVVDGVCAPHPVNSLVEYSVYQVEVEADAVFFAGRPMELVSGTSNRWHLETPFAVGRAQFRVLRGAQTHTQTIQVRSSPQKIESKQMWNQMLEDLLHWTESLLGHQGVRAAGIDVGRLQHYLLLEGLVPLLNQFQIALRQLFESLRERTIYPKESIRLNNLRAPYPLGEIIQNPVALAYLDGQGVDEIPVIEAPRAQQTFNHPVNRYVRWLIEQVLRYLQLAIIELQPNPESKQSFETQWRHARTEVLEKTHLDIQGLLRRSPLSKIPAAPMQDAAFLVVLNDPLYAAVHKIGRLLCGQSLTVNQTEYVASTARSFDIYEIWCYHKVLLELEGALGTQPEYRSTQGQIDEVEWGMTAEFQTDTSVWRVEYNAHFKSRFPKYPMGKNVPRRYSTIHNQRPDIVLYHEDTNSGLKQWMVLDAKYRTSKKNLMNAFNSAFAYNQTLFDPEYGGQPEQCVLLVPRMVSGTEPWFEAVFLETYGYGVVECRPNESISLERLTIFKTI